MLNKLPLIIVMILSLFLAFYCVDTHKDNIVKTINRDKENIEENLSNQEVKVNEISEKVYVEVLATEDTVDTNESSKIVEKAEKEIIPEPVVEEKIIIDIKEVEVKTVKVDEPKSIVEKAEIEVEKVQEEKAQEDKVVSENDEGYKLDDLEKMIMDELKKGNKD
jgi:hypothetical protein